MFFAGETKMTIGEIAMNQFLQSFSTPALDMLVKASTYLGHPGPWILLAAWLFWLGYERKSFVMMSVILLAGAVAGALKIFIARPRPEGLIIMDHETSYSMPSGHTTLITSFATFAWLKKTIKKPLKILLVLAIIIVAISRMYLGVHYFTDVLVGLLLGLLIGWAAIKIEAKIHKMHFHITKIQDEYLAVGFFAIAVILYMFIQSEYPEAFALFGYFAGYALYRHSGVDLKPVQTTKQAAIILTFGTIFTGGIYYLATQAQGLEGVGLYFLTGLFVTVFWPVIIHKYVAKREEHKAKKKKK